MTGVFVRHSVPALSMETFAALVLWTLFMLTAGLFFWILGDIVWKGIPLISWEFLTEVPRNAGRDGGIASVLVATASIVGICMLVALPVGVGTAVLLVEYSRSSSVYGRVIRISLDVLAAVPSVVFGLFGYAFFGVALGLGFSILSGGLTLACMVLPVVIRATEEGLRQVPVTYRAAGVALAMSRAAILRHVILPVAVPGIIAGFLLGLGRALAETAALLFTSGYVDRMPESIFDSGRTISIHVYDLAMNVAGGDGMAYASATVLVVALLIVNSSVVILGRFWQGLKLGK